MEDVLSCQICSSYYDLESHRPKSLPCGHTFCSECLQHINLEQGRLECPVDKEMCYEIPDELADNQSLKSLVLSLEVRCPRHLDVIVRHICLTHRCLICEQCELPCNQDCATRSLLEDKQEVTISLCTYLNTLEGQLTTFTAYQQQQLADKYTLKVQELLQLIRDFEKEVQKSAAQQGPWYACEACGGASTQLDLTSFQICCQYCLRGKASTNLGNLDQLRVEVATALTELFKKVNFCDLPLELLKGLQDIYLTPLEDLQTLGKWVLLLTQSQSDVNFAALPAVFYCPRCFQLIQKETCYMRKLPCLCLHAICFPCAEAQAFSLVDITRCPLDQMEYLMCATNLPILQPPTQPIILQPPAQSIILPELPAPQVQSLPLPLPNLDKDHFFIDRFDSVLPGEGSGPKNKGWGVNFRSNQVEVLTLTTSSTVQLYGLSLANPIGTNANVAQLSLFVGEAAAGPALYYHPRPVLLKSSQGILTYVYLSQLVELRVGTKYSLKVQFVPAEEPCEKLTLYRGNPETRPEVWIGSDNTVWEFGSVSQVEAGEFVTGRNDMSGPVLRLLYLNCN